MPNTFDLKEANENISRLIDWIEEQTALSKQYPTFDPDFDIYNEVR
jgi:hypothetical protein